MNEKKIDFPSLNDIFPFEYCGGGYFRHKNVPQLEKAEILHGIEAIEYLYNKILEINET